MVPKPIGSNVKDVPSKHMMELNDMNFNGVLKDNCKR